MSYAPTSPIFSSMALLNMSDMSSFSNISKGSPIPAPRSPTPSATSTSPFFMFVNMSLTNEMRVFRVLTNEWRVFVPCDQIIQLLAGDGLGHLHCAVIHDRLSLWGWGRRTSLLHLLWSSRVKILPETKAHVSMRDYHEESASV